MNKKFLDELRFKELIGTQITSWELNLKHKGLCQSTIDRKVNNLGLFYCYLNKERLNSRTKNIKFEKVDSLAFDFVYQGFYNINNADNEGSYEYRANIYHNIREGINYIYEDYLKDKAEIIHKLTEEQKDALQDISKNKWFRVDGLFRNDESVNENIQIRLIQELGIKVYFDKENKPYVLSHELAELIGKESKIVLRDIRKIVQEINEYNFVPVAKSTDFNMFEDLYVDSKNEKRPTYRLYKDLMLKYILGMNGKKFGKFQMEYIDAFNYIEEEYKRLLEENARLKESFLNMYNQIRKRNRELLIVDHNKKCKKAS
jgi:Rha family phage regulatory protein